MPSIRDFPYPYSAMLAICNDIDDTELSTFRNLHKFLNTKERTKWGVGLGLDVADSFWMFGPPGSPAVMSWWKGHGWASEHHAKEIAHFVRVGWIDTIHSWGDFSKVGGFTRQHAIESVNALTKEGISVPIWTNHGDSFNRQNFPGHLTLSDYMSGDNPSAPEYSSDLAKQIGAVFVQSHDVAQMHHEFPLAPVALADGRAMWAFLRHSEAHATPLRKVRRAIARWVFRLFGKNLIRDPGQQWLWHPDKLYKQISSENLDSLVQNRHFAIVTQHLGHLNSDLPQSAVTALRNLERRFRDGEILIARTSRLLRYAIAREYLRFEVRTEGLETTYDIVSIDDPVTGPRTPFLDELRGLCFISEDAPMAHLMVAGRKVDEAFVLRNKEERFVQFRWHEEDVGDYTATWGGQP